MVTVAQVGCAYSSHIRLRCLTPGFQGSFCTAHLEAESLLAAGMLRRLREEDLPCRARPVGNYHERLAKIVKGQGTYPLGLRQIVCFGGTFVTCGSGQFGRRTRRIKPSFTQLIVDASSQLQADSPSAACKEGTGHLSVYYYIIT